MYKYPTSSMVFAMSLIFIVNVNGEKIDNSTMGFSVSLPGIWIGTQKTATHFVIKDTSKTYPAVIGITVRSIDSLYATEKEWVYSASQSYQIAVQNDAFFGFIFISDSIYHGNNFSIYLNTWYGLPILAEHIRFVGVGDTGYELYVLSDTLDMQINWSVYRAIVDSIRLLGRSSIRPFTTTMQSIESKYYGKFKNELFTLSGRRVRVSTRSDIAHRRHDFSTAVYISRKKYRNATTGILLRACFYSCYPVR